MAQKRIIDKRKKEKFMVDDEYLNGMARLVGHQGTLVYFSLCRHASKNQECFPSINLMAEEHSVSTKTIQRGIKKLEERNIIEIGKKRTKSGKWLNNTYTLLDKSVWNYTQETNSPMDTQETNSPTPSDKWSPDQETNSPTKETHGEGNTSVSTETEQSSYGREDINEVIEYFQEQLQTSLDGTKRDNRRFAKLLIDKLKKDYPDYETVYQIKLLINAALKDSFHQKNATNMKYLYYNTTKIIQSLKSNYSKRVKL